VPTLLVYDPVMRLALLNDPEFGDRVSWQRPKAQGAFPMDALVVLVAIMAGLIFLDSTPTPFRAAGGTR
jgi:hypothetical protein